MPHALLERWRFWDNQPDVDFEYEGEMTPRMALNAEFRKAYPFSRLTNDANVMITPGIHSAAIATKLLGEIGEATVVGPFWLGWKNQCRSPRLARGVSDIVMLAAMAAYEIERRPPQLGARFGEVGAKWPQSRGQRTPKHFRLFLTRGENPCWSCAQTPAPAHAE